MTAFGLLHGIYGKKPDAIGHIPQVLIAGLGDRFDGLRGRGVSHDWSFLFQKIDGGKGVGRGFAGAQTGRRSDWNVSAVALIGRPRFKAGGIGFVPADRITTKSLFVAVLQYRTRGHRGLDEERGFLD